MAQWSKTGNKGVEVPDSNTTKVPDDFKFKHLMTVLLEYYDLSITSVVV